MKNPVLRRLNLSIALFFYMTAIMLAASVLLFALFYPLYLAGVFDIYKTAYSFRVLQIIVVLTSNFLLAMALTALFGKTALKRLREIIDATRQVAQGNYSVKVEEGKGIHELSQLARSFNKMTQELSSVETLRSDFINNFSHEFKTPIVSIRGFARLLKDGNLNDDERREYLEIILAESERLASLATNVLNLSKFESLEIVTEKSAFRVDEQLRSAIVMTEPKWSAKGLSVDVVMEELMFYGSADLTQQIWLNLIDNAIKFTGSGGTMTIRLARWNNGFRCIIKDTGIGMDERTASHIFDKFYQGDSSRSGSGNGLGLTIVKRIVDLYGGKIDALSEPGTGSEFIVWLPEAQ